ncbi:MAG: hypothetical protein PF482_11190 [Desulfobacteraceae bacterium]|jgi:hypothetical protein|nr:hypothetical protein [Desulfobacteraceae bacterium]
MIINNQLAFNKILKTLGVLSLFVLIGVLFHMHLPTLEPGFLNAGDDHVHVAFSNELNRIWNEGDTAMGWSRLYGAGAPIFLLRPPGLYVAVNLIHSITGYSIEESLKLVVLFGFCLFPLTMFWGARLLGLGFKESIFAGMLAPLPISLWGHTIDAYQYLGIHKQLLAILIFPVTVGFLWQLLKYGRYGALFAISFSMIFMTHPYIAYCFFMLGPCMIFSLAAIDSEWEWKKGIGSSLLWSVPVLLILCVWLIPFVFSNEIQVIDPYLSRRRAFDVVVCTTAETFRQYFLGGILDTTKFAGAFGGAMWPKGNEWGWLSNSQFLRLPMLTILSFAGWVICTFRSKSSVHGLLSLSFLLSFLLLIGPDDFPFLDLIPFAKKFQNIHAIFIFEWAAILLSAVAGGWIFKKAGRISKRNFRYIAFGLLSVCLIALYANNLYERLQTGRKGLDVRNIYTNNGELSLKPGINELWRHFASVVEELKADEQDGNISGYPLEHDDSVLYNLLPLMVNRSVFISGFELVGGVYDMLVHNFRTSLRDNYELQKLFNIRYVVNSPNFRKEPMDWHQSIQPVYIDDYWELVKVKGDFGEIGSLPSGFIGFAGSEKEWKELMILWLNEVEKTRSTVPWIINFSHSGLTSRDILKIRPYIYLMIIGDNTHSPEGLEPMEQIPYSDLPTNAVKFLSDRCESNNPLQCRNELPVHYQVLEKSRSKEIYCVDIDQQLQPLLFKRAFYNGWEVTVDGEQIPIYRISPGLQMIMISSGKHCIEWHYSGPNHWRLALTAFFAGFVCIGFLAWRGRKKSSHLMLSDQPADSHAPTKTKKRLRYAVAAVWLIFIGVFARQVFSEVYLKIPVIIMPYSGDTVESGEVDFYWNYVVGIPINKQNFSVQIATDKEFERIIYSTKVQNNEARIDNILKQKGPYYYRIRLEVDDENYRWSSTIKIYGKG